MCACCPTGTSRGATTRFGPPKGASVRAKNGRGETPLDVVSADWSPQLEQTYRTIGELVGIELDLARIKPERPKVAELLSKHAVR